MRFNRAQYSNCKECPLRDRNRVWAEGPGQGPIPIVMIGEAPGWEEEEDDENRPFVGAAGRTLNYALGKSGIMRRACWITNILSCRPPDNRFLSLEAAEAIRCCEPGFLAELEYLRKRGVHLWMPLGNHPARSFGIEEGITKTRGSVYMEAGRLILPTFHPSYIVRGQWKQEVTWINDFLKAKKLAAGGYSPPKEDFNIYPTLSDLEEFLEQGKRSKNPLGVDIETTSLDPQYGQIVVVGFALNESKAISFPFFSQGLKPYWPNKDAGKARKILRELLKLPTMFQNCMFDIPHLERHGFQVPNLVHDTLLAHHAVHPELPHNIGYIVSIYGLTPYWKSDMLGRLGHLSEEPDEKVRTYNLRDSVALPQVLPGLLTDLKEVETEFVYYNISMPLTRPVMDMTRYGLPIDQKRLKNWKATLKRRHKKLEADLREVTGTPPGFSFDSPDCLRLLIYGRVGNQFKKAKEELNKYEAPSCKLRKDTKKYQQICEKVAVAQETAPLYIPRGYGTRKTTPGGNLSVDEEARLNLQIACNNRLSLVKKFLRPSNEHGREKADLIRTLDILVLLRKYAVNEKLLTTYSHFKIGKDGRVHPKYLIHGTRTGRLAGRDPNPQNIPLEVRKVFLAPEGWLIMQFDYSNLELRILAYESGDEVLIKTFERGENVHDRNTKDLFQIGKDHPNWKSARRAAKVYIFGRNYGGGLRGIYQRVMQEAPELELTFEQFRAVDNAYRSKHPRYTAWVRRTLVEVSEKKTLRNAFGRVRIFLGDQHEIEREGLNFPIQSAAADIINTATIALYRDPKYGQTHAKLIGQIHDALVFEVPKENAEDLAKIVKRHMVQPVEFRGKKISFPVDIELGEDWGTLKPWISPTLSSRRKDIPSSNRNSKSG